MNRYDFYMLARAQQDHQLESYDQLTSGHISRHSHSIAHDISRHLRLTTHCLTLRLAGKLSFQALQEFQLQVDHTLCICT